MPEIRKPIITMLGHVDHGKTKLLDSIRGTAIVEKEAGAITQHIGATEVPIKVVEKISGELIEKFGFKLKIPGLLFIDTPGHEAFTNLRTRGGSIADLAVLVVDVMQGFQPQTIEAIEILKSFKTPFIIALNKIDLLKEYNSVEGSFLKNLKEQSESGVGEIDRKVYEIVGRMHELGFESERFDRCSDFAKQVAILPLSAKTREGLPELLMLLAGLSQKFLEKNLKIEVKGKGKGVVLEVKEEKGLGKTIDVILFDGSIKVGDEIAVGGLQGVIKTKVRALLQPKPLEEIRDPKEKFNSVKEANAAVGVKIAAPNLEGTLGGSPLLVVKEGNEEEAVKEEIESVSIESEAVGPIVRTDALGSLEALAKMLEKEKIKVHSASVGEVSKHDVMEAIGIKEKDKFKGVIFAFNVKVKPEAEQEGLKNEVQIFKGNVIYKILEDYKEWVCKEKEAEKKGVLESVKMPAKIKMLPGFVFRNTKPAIVGVRVLEGRLREDVKLFKSGKIVGSVRGIQDKGESLKEAVKGQEAAVSIQDATVGRNLMENDELLTFLTAKNLEALEKIKEELTEGEKELVEEIKKKQAKMKT